MRKNKPTYFIRINPREQDSEPFDFETIIRDSDDFSKYENIEDIVIG